MKTPLVTVLMSAYNAEKYVKEAIESILGQTYKNYEFLIINDGSTDKTKKTIKSFSDSRIKLIENKNNLGLSESLNRGIKVAKGKYIARMDADDISLSRRIEKQVRFMEKHPKVGLLGAWIKITGDRSLDDKVWKYPIDSSTFHCNLLFNNSLAHPTAFLRRSLYLKHNLFYNTDFKRSQDWELWIRSCDYFLCTNLPEVLLTYRVNSKNVARHFTKQGQHYPNMARQIALENLDTNLDDKKLHVHQQISNNRVDFNKVTIDSVIEWLLLLKKSNNRTGVFPKDIFSSLIDNKIKKHYLGYWKKYPWCVNNLLKYLC